MFNTKSDAPPVVMVNAPAPFDVRVAAAPLSPTVTLSADSTTSPVPLGVKVILPLEPSVMVILPELESEFVDILKS